MEAKKVKEFVKRLLTRMRRIVKETKELQYDGNQTGLRSLNVWDGISHIFNISNTDIALSFLLK
ncbi:unnamed protein product [Sphenostylis stenocarpa]|uniref:Uncharacterized protein n=1 Tax=Sphenostylis stenocarpa TaxID=92480 RepID=A0AA86S1P0_9FABA|nr:unnamed protein product [Sphenostylis stenocarpa]